MVISIEDYDAETMADYIAEHAARHQITLENLDEVLVDRCTTAELDVTAVCLAIRGQIIANAYPDILVHSIHPAVLERIEEYALA